MTYDFAPQPESGFHGFGRFENACPYNVLIRFRYSDGQTGMAGPIGSGQTERGYHGTAREVEFSWCDFGPSGCTPAQLGRANVTKEELDAEVERARAEIQRHPEDMKTLCFDTMTADGPTEECLAYQQDFAEFSQYYSNLQMIQTAARIDGYVSERLLEELIYSNYETVLGQSPSQGVSSANEEMASSEATGESASDCLQLSRKLDFFNNGEDLAVHTNICDRGISCRMTNSPEHEYRLHQGHDFGDSSTPPFIASTCRYNDGPSGLL